MNEKMQKLLIGCPKITNPFYIEKWEKLKISGLKKYCTKRKNKFKPLKNNNILYGLPFPTQLISKELKEKIKSDSKNTHLLMFYLAISNNHLIFFRYAKELINHETKQSIKFRKDMEHRMKTKRYTFDSYNFIYQDDNQPIIKEFNEVLLTHYIYRVEKKGRQMYINCNEDILYPQKEFINGQAYYNIFYNVNTQLIIYERK